MSDYYQTSILLQTIGSASRVISAIFGICIIISSLISIYYCPAGTPAAIAGIVFGIDMVVNSVTGYSIISFVPALFSAWAWSTAYKEKEFWEVVKEFSIWSPFAYSTAVWARVADAAWATIFSYGMSKAISFISKEILTSIPRVSNWFYEAQLTQTITKLMEKNPFVSRVEILAKITTDPGLRKAICSVAGVPLEKAIQSIPELLKEINVLTFAATADQVIMQASTLLGSTKGFTALHLINRLKKFVGGFLQFSNWIPESWVETHNILGFILNYADNILYSFVLGQNAIGFIFTVLLSIQQGENIGFLKGY